MSCAIDVTFDKSYQYIYIYLISFLNHACPVFVIRYMASMLHMASTMASNYIKALLLVCMKYSYSSW